MVRTLLTLVAAIVTRRVPLVEVASTAAVVVGVVDLWGAGAGWLAVGTAGLLKAFDWEAKGSAEAGSG